MRGTPFDVSVDEDNQSTVVSVEEGQVACATRPKSDSRIVNIGESITVYRDQPLARNLIDRGCSAPSTKRVSDALYTAVTNGRGVALPV